MKEGSLPLVISTFNLVVADDTCVLRGLGSFGSRGGGFFGLLLEFQLFQRSSLDTLVAGERHQRLVSLSNNEHIANSSSKALSSCILHMNDFKTSGMFFSGGNNTNTTQIATSRNSAEVSHFEFHESIDLASLKVKLDSIIDLNVGMRIADGSAIMKGNVRDSFGSQLKSLDLAELILGLLRSDLLESESALGVVEQSESSIGDLIDGNHIHETSGISDVGSHFVIYFDQSLHANKSHLSPCESELESVPQKDDQRERLPQLVRTRRGSRSKDSR
jgi:hypothetical protein